MTFRPLTVVCVFALLCLASPARAGLIGKQFDISYDAVLLGTPTVYNTAGWVTVTNAVEFSNFASMVDVDIADTTITFSFTGDHTFYSSDFSGFVLYLNGGYWFGRDYFPSINSATNVGVSLSENLNTLAVNLTGQSVDSGSRVVLDVAGVPEPSSVLLVTGALAGLAMVRRERKRRTGPL